MYLTNLSDFKLFGDGENLVFMDGDRLYFFEGCLIQSFVFNCYQDIFDIQQMGMIDDEIMRIPGLKSIDCQFDIRPYKATVAEGDPFAHLEIFKNFTIRELLIAVRKKLKERG